ncbi:MAG: competence/damage-inducible protein A, partial [Nitrospiraceae bacterium]
MIPSGADLLPNPVGSAPGFSLVWKGCLLAALPGVPSEAERMFDAAVVPKLLQKTRPREREHGIVHRVFHTFGLIEAEVDERLKGLVRPGGSVRLGLLASPLGVSVSLTAVGLPLKKIEVLEDLVREVRRRLGDSLYAEGVETMEEVVGQHLAQRGLTLAVAESCTGGLIGHRLTQVPGSSAYLDRVVVAYSNRAKQEVLGVPEHLFQKYGAVSAEVAAAMAAGA